MKYVPVELIGEIDAYCSICRSHPVSVDAGPKDIYPKGAKVFCPQCGHAREATLNEIRAALYTPKETTKENEDACPRCTSNEKHIGFRPDNVNRHSPELSQSGGLIRCGNCGVSLIREANDSSQKGR